MSQWLQKIGKPGKLILNRLRVVLAEKNKGNKWLAEQLKVKSNSFLKWIVNSQQFNLKTFYKISTILES